MSRMLYDNDVEIIDIKYHAFSWDDYDTYSALIIYKIK